MKRILFVMAILFCVTAAKANDVYLAQTAAGGNTGANCANAKVYTYFNSSGNWTTTGSGILIGAGTTVHLCGTITGTGGNGATAFQFQGSGANGNPVIVLWEAGAILQAPYWNDAFDINGNSHIQFNGGSVCGETAWATDTACNGLIQNTLAGTSGQTCPGGPCTQPLSDNGTAFITELTGGAITDIEIENLTMGPVYKQGPVVSDNGSGTTAIIFPHDKPTALNIHNNNFRSVMKAILIAWSDGLNSSYTMGSFTHNNFQDQCWGMGMGGNENAGFVAAGWHFDFNEISNWGNWPYIDGTSDDCHANGTQFFSYNAGSMGDSSSSFNSNYVHGDLTAGQINSSPSGLLSCQDNCGPVNELNNVIVSTCVNPCGGGNLYMNGPNGGGQKIYNNTLICNTSVSPIVIEGSPPALIKNNVISGCGVVIEIRPNCSSACATSDYNDGNGNSNPWIVTNSANSGNFISLASWQSSGEDTHSTTGNPNLTGIWNLGTGSAAKAAGTNLTGVVTGINVDAMGNARPGAGAWDMGAVQSSGSTSPAVSLAPSSVVFAGTPANSSSTAAITLTNTGTATLTISSISITGSGTFTQTNTCGGSLPAGNNCTITVEFSPVAISTVSGAVSISDNATGSPHTVSLSGTGVNVAPSNPVLVGSLPEGTVGISYSAGLTASGGSPPYKWTVTPNPPMPGLVMSTTTGLITGVPTIASSTSLQIAVTDSTGASSGPFTTTLTVNPGSGSPPPTTTVPYNLTPVPSSLKFTAASGGTSPANQTVNVSDQTPCPPPSGVPVCHWPVNITSTASWITVSPVSGTTAFKFAVSVIPTGLSVGTHTGTLILSVPPVGGLTLKNSPVSITVTLTISQSRGRR